MFRRDFFGQLPISCSLSAFLLGRDAVERPLFRNQLVATRKTVFSCGADLSNFIDSPEGLNQFRAERPNTTGLSMFPQHGYSWIRLRTFVGETVEQRVKLASFIKLSRNAGCWILLSMHLSTTWADNTHQVEPPDWKRNPLASLITYTEALFRELMFQDAIPDMVQIGNEIENGFLWPDANLPENRPEFIQIFHAATHAISTTTGTKSPKVMVHVSCGSKSCSQAFFDGLPSIADVIDAIGLSYYATGTNSLAALRANLDYLARSFGKPVFVVETAYPWTSTAPKPRPVNFPESIIGQAQFFRAVIEEVKAAPFGLGRGVFWWEPAIVDGSLLNRGLFDFQGNALKAFYVAAETTLTHDAHEAGRND